MRLTLPLVNGIANFAVGEYIAAVACLDPLVPHLARIGCCHAQREVFADTLVEALVQGGHQPRAMVALEEPLTPPAFGTGPLLAGTRQGGGRESRFHPFPIGRCVPRLVAVESGSTEAEEISRTSISSRGQDMVARCTERSPKQSSRMGNECPSYRPLARLHTMGDAGELRRIGKFVNVGPEGRQRIVDAVLIEAKVGWYRLIA